MNCARKVKNSITWKPVLSSKTKCEFVKRKTKYQRRRICYTTNSGKETTMQGLQENKLRRTNYIPSARKELLGLTGRLKYEKMNVSREFRLIWMRNVQ